MMHRLTISQEQCGEGYTVRWMQLLFVPHLLVALYPGNVWALEDEGSISHTVLEITTPNGLMFFLDGTLDQFGENFTEWTVLQSKTGYESNYKASYDKSEYAGPGNFFYPNKLSYMEEPDLQNYFWKIIAARLKDLMDELDWDSLFDKDLEDAVRDVYSLAVDKFEDAWDEARTKFLGRDKKGEDPEEAKLADEEAESWPAVPKTAVEKAKERRGFVKAFFKMSTSDGEESEESDESDEDIDESDEDVDRYLENTE
jgi:hypothetical protein